jgi:hypothetical protein
MARACANPFSRVCHGRDHGRLRRSSVGVASMQRLALFALCCGIVEQNGHASIPAASGLPADSQRAEPAAQAVATGDRTAAGGFTKYIMWIPGRGGSTWMTEMIDISFPNVIANMEIFSGLVVNMLGVGADCSDDVAVCETALDRCV